MQIWKSANTFVFFLRFKQVRYAKSLFINIQNQ